MNRFLLTIFALIVSCILYSQSLSEIRCTYKGVQVTESRILKQVDDFTITTTDGITRNLYNTLDSGKTVFVDLFYTTCSWCQFYSPIIEEIYQNTGAGQEDIEFWGISNNLFDTNNVIDQYRLNYNITNPCAGPWGGGTTALTIIVNGQNFQGFPTYCVICPDRTLYFDPCYPPTVNGFDPYFASCDTLTGISNNNFPFKSGIISVYPNPANTTFSLDVMGEDHSPVKIELFNLMGMKVFSASYNISSERMNITIPVDHLPNGVYFIKMMQNGQFTDTQKAWISR
jgi:hypothetical protein